MGACCIYFLQKPKCLSYFSRRGDSNLLENDFDTLMDLDYLEEPQLTFRINERPFTVSSYLNWVSTKPRPIEGDPVRSGDSSLNSHRGMPTRSSLSRFMGTRTPPIHSDIAAQSLLFNEVDPKGRPPPTQVGSPTHEGNWTAVTSSGGQGSHASTSAIFMTNKAAARNMISRSGHLGGVDTATDQVVDDELDGPEIARLMRRFWPRDLNFFGGASQNSSGRRSLCESQSSVASSASSKRIQRPVVLNLKNASQDDNTSAPDSFAASFEPTLDLDWDHEPGTFGDPPPPVNGRNSTVINGWYTSPFESDAFVAPSQRRNCRTLPQKACNSAFLTPNTTDPLMTKSALFSGQMVDSGFADPTL